mgnify:CR=1 FL=1
MSQSLRPESVITIETISVLPGPVELKPVVKKAFSNGPISHRSEEFLKKFSETKKMLCEIVNAKNVEIVMGSGTLANDIVAGQLSLVDGEGLILSNGEFGDRLIDHAERINLSFSTIRKKWGTSFDNNQIEAELKKNSNIRWIWMVHNETSTGMLNDLKGIGELCEKNNVLLNTDTISSVGTTEVDLSKVYLSTCVSGKGLESLASLYMIFFNRYELKSDKSLPRYLDLSYYRSSDGVPFTISSNLVMALDASLSNLNLENRFMQIKEHDHWLRSQLESIGYKILVKGENAIPSVLTVDLPVEVASVPIGDFVKANGFLLSYQSSYLINKNWVQICLMGNLSKPMLENLIGVMKKAYDKFIA